MRLRHRAFVLPAVVLLAAGLLAACGAPPRGPELRACEPIDLPKRAAERIGSDGRVAVCGNRPGTHAIVVTHALEDESPWVVWLVDVRHDRARRAMRVTGKSSKTDDGLSAWHEALAAGFSRRGDEAIVGDVRVAEHSDGSDEPAHRVRARWWAIDIGDAERRELATDSYDVDELRE